MTDHDGFLQAIIEDPLSDVPRLVYADWLDEHGQGARAEFIRVQVELARLYSSGGTTADILYFHDDEEPGIRAICDCIECVLRRRERELLEEHWTAWSAKCHAGYCMNLYTGRPLSPPNRTITFRRGFVESVTLSCDDFMRHAEALFRAAPILEVKLSDKKPWLIVGDDPETCWEFTGTWASWTLPFELVPPGRGGKLEQHCHATNDSAGCAVFRRDKDGEDEVQLRDAAHRWLSDTCVKWGRKKVKLPELNGFQQKER